MQAEEERVNSEDLGTQPNVFNGPKKVFDHQECLVANLLDLMGMRMNDFDTYSLHQSTSCLSFPLD